MKYLSYIFLLSSLFINAQDTLIFKNQSKVVSLILLAGEDSIRYKKIDNIVGPDLYARNSDLSLIKYKTGRVENVDSLYQLYKNRSLLTTQKLNSDVDENSPERKYEMGKFHAEVNYKCKGCTVGFLALGLLLGPVSAIPAFSVMFITPSNKNLAYPSEDLWSNEDYQRGYKDKARKMKAKAIGTGISIGTILSAFVWGLALHTISGSGS